MEVLWQVGPATVHQVMEALPAKLPLAYNSVLTTIRILEKKGYVQHVKEGRAHVYAPLVGNRKLRVLRSRIWSGASLRIPMNYWY